MLLAIDAGNTNIVFGVFDGDELKNQWRLSTVPGRTSDEYGALLMQFMGLAGINPSHIGAAIISSVVPNLLFDLRLMCRSYFNANPQVVGDLALKLGIDILYARPSELGADLVANAVAANKLYGGNVIVVDFGTATTFHVSNEDGAMLGGVISPGINLSINALHAAAAKLPKIAIERPDQVIGDSTISAMQSGIYWGYIGLVEGIITRIKLERNIAMKTVVTGGLASLFFAGTDQLEYLEPNLTMIGLHHINTLNS